MARHTTENRKSSTFQIRVHKDKLDLFKLFCAQEGISATDFVTSNMDRFISEHLFDKEAAKKVIESNVDLAPAVLAAMRENQDLIDKLIGKIIVAAKNDDALDLYTTSAQHGADLVPFAPGTIDPDAYPDADLSVHYWTIDDLKPWPDLRETADNIINEYTTHGYSSTLRALTAAQAVPDPDPDETGDTASIKDRYLAALDKL